MNLKDYEFKIITNTTWKHKMIGIRLPIMRDIAKVVAKVIMRSFKICRE